MVPLFYHNYYFNLLIAYRHINYVFVVDDMLRLWFTRAAGGTEAAGRSAFVRAVVAENSGRF